MTEYPANWSDIADRVKGAASWHCIRCGHGHDFYSRHVLTVHHWNGDKSDCRWWNLLALCQRCHLNIQARVDPEQPYMFEHSDWIKSYAAGFYAYKYLAKELTREQTEARLDELLALERIA